MGKEWCRRICQRVTKKSEASDKKRLDGSEEGKESLWWKSEGEMEIVM
jgi:hypothetical protein